MTTTLEASFLLACLRMMEFKGAKMLGAQAALLRMALEGSDFDATALPPPIVGGSRHLAGAAVGSLVAQGLLIVVGRVKSPKENAKGRRLDVLRLAPGKRSTAIAFLKANNLPAPEAGQQLQLIA